MCESNTWYAYHPMKKSLGSHDSVICVVSRYINIMLIPLIKGWTAGYTTATVSNQSSVYCILRASYSRDKFTEDIMLDGVINP